MKTLLLMLDLAIWVIVDFILPDCWLDYFFNFIRLML